MCHIIHYIYFLCSVIKILIHYLLVFFLIYFKYGIKIHKLYFKRNINSTERTDLQNFKANFKSSAVIIPSVSISINNFLLIYEALGGEKKKISA